MKLKLFLILMTLFVATTAQAAPKYEKAILAGGCFWGMEELLRGLEGVSETRVGYTGDSIPNPTYELVSSGLTKHVESVEVLFDSQKISYEKLLKFFFTIHDPTTANRQGNDVGLLYGSVIFYLNDEQKQTAADVIKQANASKVFKNPLTTKLVKAGQFWPAEEYHQKYLQKNPYGYTCHHVREEWKF